MEAAAADDDPARGHANHAAVGDERGESVDRGAIVRHAIGRYDNRAVADVEIHITCRRDLAADLDPAGRGEVYDLDPAELRRARARVDIDMRIGVIVTRRDGQREPAFADETREIVDTQLATIEKQLSKDSPNPKLLLPLATAVATALTTTGAVGQGLDYIHRLIELLAGLA